MKKKWIAFLSAFSILLGGYPVLASDGESETENGQSALLSRFENSLFHWNSNRMPVLPFVVEGTPKWVGMSEESLGEIDGIINQAISQKTIPGAVAMVSRAGMVVKKDAYGYAAKYSDGSFGEIDHPVPMNENTIFDLASISKIFTSVALMKLYEQGLFNLDDHVGEYIPAFSANGKEEVTIRQLLTHTSGFTSWIPLYTKGTSREDRLEIVFNQPLKNPPGTKYEYSDLNMITIGALIEKMSGMRQDEFVKKHITKPIGMKDTMYNPPAQLKNRIAATEFQATPPRGLVWGEVHDENAWALDGVAGHAGVFSTADDLAKFAHIFINDGKYLGKQILKKETVKLLLENQNEAFPGNDHGLGWELGQGWYMDALSEGNSSFGHTGYTGTSMVVNPGNKTVAILLTNRVHPSRNTVSLNETRRLFARQAADAIPVDMPERKIAWFSGYGDRVERVMETDLKHKKETELTFDMWHIVENGADFGYVEVQVNGQWEELASFTGTSSGWKRVSLTVPGNSEKIRFKYETDATVNGRGWYILDPKLDSRRIEFAKNEWEQRGN